jgi:hypothetical protein
MKTGEGQRVSITRIIVAATRLVLSLGNLLKRHEFGILTFLRAAARACPRHADPLLRRVTACHTARVTARHPAGAQ